MAELLQVHNCMNMNRRALAWPKKSHILIQIPRRSPHRLSFWAGYESWRHTLAPKLPTPRYHIPAPNPKIAVQIDVAQVASPMSKESPGRPQRGPGLPQPNQTHHRDQNQDQDLPLSILPDVSEEPVAGRALRRQTVDMFQQPGLATYLRSARQTCSRSCSFVALFCANYELQPLEGWSEHELCASCMGVERACATAATDTEAEADEEAVAETPGSADTRAPATTPTPQDEL